MPITVPLVFLAALLTALATGLGALPLLIARHPSRQHLGLANAAAAGLMIAASLMLLYEGGLLDVLLVAVGAGVGALFIVVSRRYLDTRETDVGALRGADARKALLIIGVMTVHSFTEGVGVGVSYGGGDVLGAFITTAIAVHNIPEGLAISLVMVPRGTPVWQAAGWSIFSSLPQPLMAVPAFLFVETFAPFLPVGLGFAAGAMLWMSASELLPEASRDAPRGQVVVACSLAVAAMLAFQYFLKG